MDNGVLRGVLEGRPRSFQEAEGPMSAVFTYARSKMKPHFWVIFCGAREMAETWDEDDAKEIVRALNRNN